MPQGGGGGGLLGGSVIHIAGECSEGAGYWTLLIVIES